MTEQELKHFNHEFANLRVAAERHRNPVDSSVYCEAINAVEGIVANYFDYQRAFPVISSTPRTDVPENDAISTNANLFRSIVCNTIARPGIDELMTFVYEGSDFYGAPCSTVYHLCVHGGLVLHSLMVYQYFDALCAMFRPDFPAESRAICALFHDLCKANTYKPCRKSRKTGEVNTYGKPVWKDYDGFEFDEVLPYGHGEKSVYLLMKYIDLTDEEAMSIRWHMGAYDNSAKSDARTLGKATEKYPVITLLHCADLIATSMGF